MGGAGCADWLINSSGSAHHRRSPGGASPVTREGERELVTSRPRDDLRPIFAGKLTKNAQGSWTLGGLLTCRIPLTELLAATGRFDAPGGADSGLCNSPFFTTVRTTLCNAVDIRRSSAFDFKQGDRDAISPSIVFTAEEAEVGEVRSDPNRANPCAKVDVPAATYSCPLDSAPLGVTRGRCR